MKTLSLFIGLLLLADGVQAQFAKGPDPASWKRYTVQNEEFSVTLPTLPVMISNKSFSSQLKKERGHRLISTVADGVDYRIEAYENPQRQQSLQEFIAEAASAYGFDVSTGRDVTISGFPGREYLYKDRLPGTEQFFATEERLYRFATRGATADHPGVKQFFSSISLGKNQEGIQITDGIGEPLGTATGPQEKVYTSREVDQRVKLKSRPHPEYPDAAKSNHIRGTVILKVIFRADGRVTDIRTIQGLPGGLTEKAIEAARKIKFIPATKDGKNVSMYMQIEYHFNLY
jgi:TonB family protein